MFDAHCPRWRPRRTAPCSWPSRTSSALHRGGRADERRAVGRARPLWRHSDDLCPGRRPRWRAPRRRSSRISNQTPDPKQDLFGASQTLFVHAGGRARGRRVDVRAGASTWALENILLGHCGAPHVADLEFTRGVVQGTAASVAGPAVGTPGFMAPELRGGGQPSSTSGMFSLGKILERPAAMLDVSTTSSRAIAARATAHVLLSSMKPFVPATRAIRRVLARHLRRRGVMRGRISPMR